MRNFGLCFLTINNLLFLSFIFLKLMILNKRKINKLKDEYVTKFEYRVYSKKEISNLLSVCDERGKAAVLLMMSTDIRIGILFDIKLKHLKRLEIYNQGTRLYQVTAYSNFPKDKYTTFCTPECTKTIDII